MDTDALRQFLLTRFEDAKLTSAGREVMIRCRFCGDSQKDLNARHLYLFLGDRDKPPMYHCFKCNESGLLTRDLLRQWLPTVSDTELKELNLNTAPRRKIYSRHFGTIYNIHIPIHVYPTYREQESIVYVQNRLGLRLSYEELIRDKIILDPVTFVQYNGNRIENQLYISNLDDYVGFLSMDNSSIILRNIRNSEHRYRHIRLVNDRNSLTYYCMPSVVNRMDFQHRVHIRIAEGVFDILGVCYNVMQNTREQNIYMTSNGKDHMKTIMYATLSFSLFSPIIDLYLDNDTDKRQYSFIQERLKMIGIPVYFHKNIYPGEKDFGVRKDHIVDNVFR